MLIKYSSTKFLPVEITEFIPNSYTEREGWRGTREKGTSEASFGLAKNDLAHIRLLDINLVINVLYVPLHPHSTAAGDISYSILRPRQAIAGSKIVSGDFQVQQA